MIFFDETIRILISGNVKKGPHLYNAALDVVEKNDKKGQRFFNVASDVMEQNQANRLAKHPDRFNQDKLFGKFQKLSLGSVKQGGSGQGKECIIVRDRLRFCDQVGHQTIMHLLERSIFSINNIILRFTKIMNRAAKNWAHF